MLNLIMSINKYKKDMYDNPENYSIDINKGFFVLNMEHGSPITIEKIPSDFINIEDFLRVKSWELSENELFLSIDLKNDNIKAQNIHLPDKIVLSI